MAFLLRAPPLDIRFGLLRYSSIALMQCFQVLILSSDEIAYTSNTVSFTKRSRSGSTASFPRVPVQFLLSNSPWSKICLSNCTAKFPIEQLLHLIWVSSSWLMYSGRTFRAIGGGGMSFSLSEPGDESSLEAPVFAGLTTIDGVLEFNGAWGLVGVLIGVVFSTRGEGETEEAWSAGSCVAAEGGCSPREFSLLLRMEGIGATFTEVGIVVWLGREPWSAGKNEKSCSMPRIILFWLWRMVAWFTIMARWFSKMAEKRSGFMESFGSIAMPVSSAAGWNWPLNYFVHVKGSKGIFVPLESI